MSDLSLSPREMILTLIDSAASSTLSAGYFIAAGELFGLDPRSVRVALVRLVKDGSLLNSERGMYSLGSRGGTLHTLVRNWAQVETSLKRWSGGWLAVFTAHLTRSNKTSLRSRERALGLFGFAESTPGLWIRPDNLVMPLAQLHAALGELGLDDKAVACVISEMLPAETRLEKLWDRQALEDQYHQHLQTLQTSMAGLDTLSDREAGKETLLLGRQVTRSILLDPLLPPEMIDAELRQQMVTTMREYDSLGKSFWRSFYASHHAN